jgi:hypothetical protein
VNLPVDRQTGSKGVFGVTRFYSRTRILPACVAPAKNNFIWVPILKRNSVPILESDGAHAPYYANDCLYHCGVCIPTCKLSLNKYSPYFYYVPDTTRNDTKAHLQKKVKARIMDST